MAIILTTTDERVTLVHTDDPDVTPKQDTTDDQGNTIRAPRGWVMLSDVQEARPAATRVQVRALAGHEFLSINALRDRGQQAMETVRKAVVDLDGKPLDPRVVERWAADVLLGLEARIDEVSVRPTVARR